MKTQLLVCLSVLICADWVPLSYTKSLGDKVYSTTFTYVDGDSEFEVSFLTSWETGETCFGEDSCYPLLERGSCEDTQWVVLDKSPSGLKLQPTCREKPPGAPKCPGAQCAGSYFNFLGKAECCCPSYDEADSLKKLAPCGVRLHPPPVVTSAPFEEVKPECATSNTAECAKKVEEEKKKPDVD